MLVGTGIGVVLAAGNLYLGLRTGFVDGGSLSATLVGFLLFAGASRRGAFTPEHNNLLQASASGAAIMGSAVGLLGVFPALAMAGHRPVPAAAMIVWGLSLTALGIAAALPLRRRLIEDEKLPFPTGAAVHQLIGALHGDRGAQKARSRTLGATFLGAGVFTWLRDAQHLIPGMTPLPGTLWGTPAAAVTLGVGYSPMLASVGIMAGLRVAASLFLGSLIAWAALSPWLVSRGIVAQADYGALATWLVWPGIALGLGAAVPGLPGIVGRVRSTFVDLREVGRSGAGGSAGQTRLIAAVVLGALCGVIAVSLFGLGLGLLMTVLGLLLVLPMAGVVARSAGETDVAPAGQVGQLTQLMLGAGAPGASTAHALAAGIPSGAAPHTAQLLWSMKAAQLLNAPTSRVVFAHAIGALAGGLIVVPLYLLIVSGGALGTAALPAPGAQPWRALIELFSAGAAVPPSAVYAAIIAFLAGAALAWSAKTKAAALLPSPAAVGVGFFLPAFFAVPVLAGGLIAYVMNRARPQLAERHLPAAAAGGIAGEAIVGVIAAALGVLGWLAG